MSLLLIKCNQNSCQSISCVLACRCSNDLKSKRYLIVFKKYKGENALRIDVKCGHALLKKTLILSHIINIKLVLSAHERGEIARWYSQAFIYIVIGDYYSSDACNRKEWLTNVLERFYKAKVQYFRESSTQLHAMRMRKSAVKIVSENGRLYVTRDNFEPRKMVVTH